MLKPSILGNTACLAINPYIKERSDLNLDLVIKDYVNGCEAFDSLSKHIEDGEY